MHFEIVHFNELSVSQAEAQQVGVVAFGLFLFFPIKKRQYQSQFNLIYMRHNRCRLYKVIPPISDLVPNPTATSAGFGNTSQPRGFKLYLTCPSSSTFA